jgi:hypothetical protein
MCRFHLAVCTLPTEPAGIPPEAASAHFQVHFSSSMIVGESPHFIRMGGGKKTFYSE